MPINVALNPIAQQIYDSIPWLKELDIKLITDKQSLIDYLSKNESKYIVYDLETTGLNPEVDRIVGFCLAYTEYEGVYIPVTHDVGQELNMSIEEVKSILNDYFQEHIVLAYNAKFELGFSLYNGIKLPFFEDVMVSVFLHDSNSKELALKSVCKSMFNIETIPISSLFPDSKKKSDIHFNKVHPLDAVIYGAQDGVLTLRLYNKLAHVRTEQPYIYKLENKIIEVLHWMECNNKVKIDVAYIEKLEKETQEQIDIVRKQIFRMAGKEFLLDSPKVLAKVLFEDMQISTEGIKPSEKSGQLPTNNDALQIIMKRHPIAPLIEEYRTLTKSLNSYISSLKINLNKDSRGKVSFRNFGAPCLTEDAILISKDKGFISIRDIAKGNIIWTLRGWDEVVNWVSVGEKECYEVEFHDGRKLTGTGHHPVLTYRGAVGIADLHVNDEAVRFLLPDAFDFFYESYPVQSYNKVKAISYAGLKRVYDITMKREPWFIANGVVTHNTGRFASGGGGEEAGYLPLNLQSIPATYATYIVTAKQAVWEKDINDYLDWFASFKPTEAVAIIDEVKQEKYKSLLNMGGYMRSVSGKPYCFAKQCFSECPFDHTKCVESKVDLSLSPDIRRAIVPEDGSLIWAIDYAAVELRVAAALSREPQWCDPINKGEDLHGRTAQNIFGDGWTKQQRQYAKTCLAEGSQLFTLLGLINIEDLNLNKNNFLLNKCGQLKKWALGEPTEQECLFVTSFCNETVTRNHLYLLTNGEWKQAEDLKIGDTFFTPVDYSLRNNYLIQLYQNTEKIDWNKVGLFYLTNDATVFKNEITKYKNFIEGGLYEIHKYLNILPREHLNAFYDGYTSGRGLPFYISHELVFYRLLLSINAVVHPINVVRAIESAGKQVVYPLGVEDDEYITSSFRISKGCQ